MTMVTHTHITGNLSTYLVYKDLLTNTRVSVIAPVAHHTETLEKMVVYQSGSPRKKQTLVISQERFNQNVQLPGVDADACPRFQSVHTVTTQFSPAYTGNAVQPGAQYQHYRNGKKYTILDVAYEAQSNDQLVVYRAEYTDEKFGTHALWVRPLAMFTETVTENGNSVARFKKIS